MRDTPKTTVRRAALALAGVLAAVAAPSIARAAEAAPQGRAVPAVTARRLGGVAVAERVHVLLGERMPEVDAATRARLGRAILEESTRARLDPLLVLAVIHVESSYRLDAVSPAGALGLMQLCEPTFRRELELEGLPAHEGDPRDPEASVRIGIRYLKRLVNAFGPLDTALMAYNAGPNRILFHLRAGAIPERFLEYPRRVRAELARLVGGAAPRTVMVASAAER